MLSIRDWPIRQKLTLIASTSAIAALALAGAAFAFNEFHSIRHSQIEQLTTLAEVLGQNVTTSLEFDDANTGKELLSSLNQKKSVEGAILFRQDINGTPQSFASFVRGNNSPEDLAAYAEPAGTHFRDGGFVDIVHPVVSDGELIGTLWIRSNLAELDRRFLELVAISIVVLGISLALGVLITHRLQQYFTEPISDLVDAMKVVGQEDDYNLQVQRSGDDELGILCDGFNQMLSQVRTARTALEQSNDELEERVAERTSQLQVALDNAEASNRAKGQFLANMSHEIRTPMTAILGYADLLEDEEGLTEPGRDQIRTIRRNGRHLINIINDILDVSRIEAGKLHVERVACNVCSVVCEVISLMRPRALEAGLRLEMTYDGMFPETIHTDPTRLHQILTNLIGNAIKFTEKGRVELRILMVESDDGESKLQFIVRDTGIGMSEAQVSKIFDPFTQADETMTRRFGGTGLGLTISRSLARLLGGDLSAESQPGEGSTFSFTVAAGELEGVTMLARCRESVSDSGSEIIRAEQMPGNVLLVEDGRDNQLLVAAILRRAGLTVSVAENGEIGKDMALQAVDSGAPFNLILMDMQMPVMDGYEATKRLRDTGYKLPIVALTAHAMSGDAERCLAAGCDAYATKPINRQELLSQVVHWVARSHSLGNEDGV